MHAARNLLAHIAAMNHGWRDASRARDRMNAGATSPSSSASLRDRIRFRHYSIRTERAYVHWTRWFIAFHSRRNPADLGIAEVTAFLTSLATERKVASATRCNVWSNA